MRTGPRPEEFAWSSSGPIAGWNCVQILEPGDPHTWDDNYFCSRYEDHGMTWSHAGPIAGMTCVQVIEAMDPDGWDDNYLCLPTSSSVEFLWQFGAGSILTEWGTCVQWSEASDPHTWHDNYMCWRRKQSGE